MKKKDILEDAVMTEQSAEKISMLVDGELDQQKTVRLLGNLRDDDQLQRYWQCYHLIGDAMRSNLPDNNSSILASNICKALESEPALVSTSSVVYPSFSKPVVGLALAASVAMVTLIGFQWNTVSTTGASSPQIAEVSLGVPSGGSSVTTEILNSDDLNWIATQPEIGSGLNYFADENDIYVIPRKSPSINLVDFESN